MEHETRAAIERGTTEAYTFARPPWLYTFGPFRLDPNRGILTCGSEIVPLPGRLFTILIALLRANGAVVSREELYALIWPNGATAENNLAQHVYMLRRLLGERAGDRLYIMTVHNRGFRFVAPISIVEPSDTTERVEPIAERQASRDELLRPGLNAFTHYTRGCDLVEQEYASALLQAVDHFEAALTIYPDYFPALIWLARARTLLALNEYSPRQNEFSKAKDAVIRALQIDPSSAAAHAVLSSITLYCDWSWREAKRELDVAVSIAPDNGLVRRNAVALYEWTGFAEKSLVEVQRAIALEPTSFSLQLLLGRMLARCGEYESAIAHFTNIIDSSETAPISVRRHRAETLIVNGQHSDAILDLLLIPNDRAEDLAWRYPLLCLAYAGNGDIDKAGELYAMLIAAAKTEYVANRNLVAPALALGDRGAALRHFERAIEAREASLPLLRYSPTISVIRASDAFKSLIDALG